MSHQQPQRRARPRPAPIRTKTSPARIAVAVLSVLVLLVTGFAWRGVDSLRSSLATASGLGLGGGKDGAIDILMVGTDSRTDAHGNPLSQSELDSLRAGEEVASNTDTIILIRVPNDGSSATAISIPRDAYVNVPGIGMSKINAAFGATKETERLKLVNNGSSDSDADKKSTEAGRTALIGAVANLTGITVDHYAEVGLLGFVLLTNAVGGVDVCLNAPVDEPMSGANFAAGKQTLDGADALSFVRQRHDLPRGDLDRIVRQQVFMASLVSKVLSAKTLSDPGKLSQLTSAVQRSVVIDDDWDIIEFAKQLQNLAGGKVQFETIPVLDINGMTDYGESIVKVDPKAVKKYIAGLVGADSEDSEATSEAPTTVNASSITVDVANASDIAGLASGVSEALSALGYKQGQVGNNTGADVSESTVFAKSADDDAALAVAEALGGLTVKADSSLSSGKVRVVIAEDYNGPQSADAVSPSEGAATTTESAGTTETSPTPAPPGPPIDAASNGPRCVN
ncbi:LCP family protein [Rhodococcus erythropolis]|nr:LCP family protein [Rhodococcus erythropolis]MCD2103913.1 LCP family protein [Rhodococcus qingshengii]MCZ4522966.1 LCP family protein [Rhodococcus erythropolis]